MGFFSELKEDLSQAVNELVPDEDLEKAAQASKDEEMLKEAESVFLQKDEPDMKEDEEYPNPMEEEKEEPTPAPYLSAPEIPAPQPEPVAVASREQNEDEEEETDEVSTVTKRMVISGDLESSGSLDLLGVVNGNIKIRGKLNITGSITGDSEAAEVYAQDAKVKGNITSRGSIKIGNNSVIRGNLYATSAVIAGAVKGDIDVKGPVILDSSAIVMGNIKSKAVQINNGAVIEGLCSQCYADISPSAFFKD